MPVFAKPSLFLRYCPQMGLRDVTQGARAAPVVRERYGTETVTERLFARTE